jgi:hypothetical protein
VQKTGGSWKMTVDYHSYQVLTPIATVVPDVVSLLEQISCLVCSYQATAFFSILVLKAQQKKFAFS